MMVNCAADLTWGQRAMPEDFLRKGNFEEGSSLQDVVVQLRLNIAALERELSHYGSKYGFTDTARALLTRPRDE
jgi:hypothetical protein